MQFQIIVDQNKYSLENCKTNNLKIDYFCCVYSTSYLKRNWKSSWYLMLLFCTMLTRFNSRPYLFTF